ncbi:MAG: hypothetical protein J0I84_04305 [Terrimonas sp.]|nr:hypothetical protein [Terrimonas sp.]
MKLNRFRHINMFKLLLTCLFCVVVTSATTQNIITEKNIRFIEYYGFPGGNSAWDDIGYNPMDNTVYVGITDHRDKVALYIYDPVKDSVKLKGFINDLGRLRSFQWQAKIHSKFAVGPKGEMYFATDGGESREEYLMEHPGGYAGGFMMKWDPVQDRMTNLGMGMQYESIKDIDVDITTGNVYAVSYPQVHFLIYDQQRNALKDYGRLGSAHVPRMMFTDTWGNCYYTDWRQRLVKYEKSQDKLIFASNSLPAFEGTPGEHIITGITAFAKDEKKGVIYLITYGAKVLAFYPQQNGIGRVEDLGGVIDIPGKQRWNYYVPNLNVGDNGKLYYIIGGHGIYAKKDRSLLVEFDPATKTPRILFEYPSTVFVEATGCNTKDRDGNMYFAGKKNIPPGTDKNGGLAELGGLSTVPFLVKFNPDKTVY